jgi:ketosteroid isomerase-like protein
LSQDNVDVVRRYQESAVGDPPPPGADGAFTEDSVATCMTYLDENVAFRPFPGMPGHGGDWIGHEGYQQMCEAYGSAWEAPKDVRFEYLDAGGDKVVLLISFDSTSRITGDTVPVRMVEIITVRDGKIVELVPYYHDGHRIVMTGGGPKQPW